MLTFEGTSKMLLTSTSFWATSDQTRNALASNSLLHMLKRRLDNKTARIGIISTGLDSLPFAERFALKGYRTSGFGLDTEKFGKPGQGANYTNQVVSPGAALHINSRYFVPQAGFPTLGDQDAVLICVPAALDLQRESSLTFIREAAIAQYLRHGQLIVLEGTPSPHLADQTLLSLLEESGLNCPPSPYCADQQYGTWPECEEPDFFLAFSPRVAKAGKRARAEFEAAKIVAGLNGPSALAAQALYQSVFEQPIQIKPSRTTAELSPSVNAPQLREA